MPQQLPSTEEAMNRVLEAEHGARDSIAACEKQAATLVDDAQQQARRIHARTDARISQVHAHCAMALGRQVERLLQQEADTGTSNGNGAEMREVLDAAVERLADALTGAGDAND